MQKYAGIFLGLFAGIGLAEYAVHSTPAISHTAASITDSKGKVIGSGLVLPGKLLLTTYHVAKRAKNEIVAEDRDHDLALVRTGGQSDDLPTLRFAASVSKGEPVWVSGSPFGYEGTVTHGVISHTSRSITTPWGVELRGMVQTDAAINPGNSGGPMVNSKGEIVGIVSLIGEGHGIAFAIPAEQVKTFLERASHGQ